MVAIRTIFWSTVISMLFALAGWCGYCAVFRRVEYRSEAALYLFGLAGAFVGAIAAAGQCIVDQLRQNQMGEPGEQ